MSQSQNKPFVFFDLGQTLIDERDYIAHFDEKFRETLQGFGTKIDRLNYNAIRDSVIRDRRIGSGSIRELTEQICNFLCPSGYSSIVVPRLENDTNNSRKRFFHFFDEAERTLKSLSEMNCEMGVIANQSPDVMELLNGSELRRFFKVIVISSLVGIKKPDPKIFDLAIRQSGRLPSMCIMVGDRLDTDICPANTLGMTTIRTLQSIFSLQAPKTDCEVPNFTAENLLKVTEIVKSIIPSQSQT